MSSEYTVVEDSKQPHGTVYRWQLHFLRLQCLVPDFRRFFHIGLARALVIASRLTGGHAEDRTLLNCTMTTRDVLLTPFSVIQLIASFVITFVLNFLIAYYSSEGACRFDSTPSTVFPCVASLSRRQFASKSVDE
jgi:hypothetical protein